ncbi:MAG TPA: helix-turn-helix transcriptional regulator [Candidatus Limnocylindrales bacterium]|nr:helix-turn-helix transcriptional regulator [Candidatus Limnocylindrales bacterium]
MMERQALPITMCGVSTRESRVTRGRRRGVELQTRALSELRQRRILLGVSQSAVGAQLGWSQAKVWRAEASTARGPTLIELSEMASVLGLELSLGLHMLDDGLRDAGQQGLTRRLRAVLSPSWHVVAELPLPGPAELRAWDLFLRLGDHRVGVELETRLRDVQALVRRLRLRERDGGVDAIVLVLADSSTNRRLVGELREALRPDFRTSPRQVLGALRAGKRLSGSGVVLL